MNTLWCNHYTTLDLFWTYLVIGHPEGLSSMCLHCQSRWRLNQTPLPLCHHHTGTHSPREAWFAPSLCIFLHKAHKTTPLLHYAFINGIVWTVTNLNTAYCPLSAICYYFIVLVLQLHFSFIMMLYGFRLFCPPLWNFCKLKISIKRNT